MRTIIMGAVAAMSVAVLADTFYWHGPNAQDSNREGDWMDEDAWMHSVTGELYTWQEEDTHDVVFDPARVGSNGWLTRINLPTGNVTPHSVFVVPNIPACRFCRAVGDEDPAGRIVTSAFVSGGNVQFQDGTTLQTASLVVDGGVFKYDGIGLAALSLCEAIVVTNAMVTCTVGGILTSAIDVTGSGLVTSSNYGQGDGNCYTLAGAVTLHPDAVLIQSEASYQWRPYEISGTVTLLGDATLQGGTGDANRSLLTGGVSGGHTLTLHVVGTNPAGGMAVQNAPWDGVEGLVKTGTGILTLSVENLLGDAPTVQRKKSSLFSIQEGLVRLASPLVAQEIRLGETVIDAPGLYDTFALDPLGDYFTPDSTGAITIPPPMGTLILLR
ncbi:MAG: hypothetical protein FWF84_05380 [Kiritimatiellaeota bacterium]|nr:hypothetical protein [Kiritimatiellota bacterium]